MGSWAISYALIGYLLLSLFYPGIAYAGSGVLSYDDMAVVWGPSPVGTHDSETTNNGYIVTANSATNAALLVCGVDLQDSRLTHDVKEVLRTSSSGGAFYRLASLFKNCENRNGGMQYPGWISAPFAIIDTLAALYGTKNVWYVDISDDELASAQEDLDVILNGGTLGGGSGGGTPSINETGVFTLPGVGKLYSRSNIVDAGELTLTLTANAKTSYDANIATHPYVYAYMQVNVTNQAYNKYTGYLYISDTPAILSVTEDNTSYNNCYDAATKQFVKVYVHPVTMDFASGSDVYRYSFSGYKNLSYSQAKLSNIDLTNASHYTDGSTENTSSNVGMAVYTFDNTSDVGSGTVDDPGDEPSGPDLEWPDLVPDINIEFNFDTSDIVRVLSQILVDMKNLDRSTNDLVDLSGVISAINGIEHPATDLSGIEGYLSDILDSLGDVSGLDVNGILGMLGHVHNDLYDVNGNLEDIETAIGNISPPAFDDSDILSAINGLSFPEFDDSDILSAINGLDFPTVDLTDLQDSFDDLLDLAQDTYTDLDTFVVDMLGYWNGLDDEFVAFFTGWDGFVTNINGKWTNLMNKLDQIYRRLYRGPWREPTGPGIDLPDPGTDIVPIGPHEIDFPLPHFDWPDLSETLHIPALKAALLELMAKFPFCLLNELVTIGTYIQRPGVAPEFDVPAPNPSDWSSPHLVHISLEQFDVAAAVLRHMILIWFIVRISNRTIRMWIGDKEVY